MRRPGALVHHMPSDFSDDTSYEFKELKEPRFVRFLNIK